MNSKFYKNFGISPVDKDFLNKQEIYNIYKKPKKDKRIETPRFYNLGSNTTHQMDILYMPKDKDYKYMVVVVDVGTRAIDAEPLKEVNSKAVLEAVKKIYKRGPLKEPHKIITDSGAEFKGEFEKYNKDNDIAQKKALAGRHRQVGIVEKMNGILGKALFMRMASQELLTGEPSLEWVEDLPEIIDAMNDKYSKGVPTIESLLKQSNPMKDLKQNLIPLNTTVRIALDEPKGITGEKLHGRFRATDHRFSLEKYKVVDYVFDPVQPVMYILDKKLGKNEHVAYTRNQLQIVSSDEEDAPFDKVVRGNKERDTYIVREILDKRKFKGKDQYLIWWKGFPKTGATWEYSVNIPKDLINKFNRQN